MFRNSDVIFSAFDLLQQINPTWLDGIINKQNGSQWGERLKGWTEIATLPWKRLPSAELIEGMNPQCSYYHCTSGLFANATENIRLLSEFGGDFSSIQIKQGTYGVDLVSDLVQPRRTRQAWLILGPRQGSAGCKPEIVWTAYPGQFAICASAHKLWDGTLDCLELLSTSGVPIAVKANAQ